MIYSKTSGYAIRALGFLAARSSQQPVDIRSIAKACRVSPTYLAKIFQVLTRSGFVYSHRGVGGGYSFRRKPSEITLLSVIQATDDPKQSPLSNCVMGLAQCGNETPCLVHSEWLKLTFQVKSKFAKSTIKDLAELGSHWKSLRQSKKILSKKVRAVLSA